MKRIQTLLILVILFAASDALGQASQPTPPTKKPQHAPLSQQKVCAEEAHKAFNEFYPPDKSATAQEFTSHYDTESRVCYILVHVARDAGLTVSYTVFDAVEGRSYASYIWVNPQKKKFWEVSPAECVIYPRGGEKIQCKDSDEFDALVDKYFGIAK
jgi:hypothetical protein